MDSGNNSGQSFLLSAYFCIHIQSCVIYVNHPQVWHDYQNQHSYELKRNKGEVCWKGKLNSLKEMRTGLINRTSVAPVVTLQRRA